MDHAALCSDNDSPEHSLHGQPHVQLPLFPDHLEQMKKHMYNETRIDWFTIDWFILYYTILLIISDLQVASPQHLAHLQR